MNNTISEIEKKKKKIVFKRVNASLIDTFINFIYGDPFGIKKTLRAVMSGSPRYNYSFLL